MKRAFLAALAACSVAFAASPARAEPPKKSPALLEKGRASYQINCASCHGDKGRGDGVAAATLNPKPRAFATDKFKGGSKPAEIFATLGKGVVGTTMVPFAHLPEEERWGLAYYVLELKGAKKK